MKFKMLIDCQKKRFCALLDVIASVGTSVAFMVIYLNKGFISIEFAVNSHFKTLSLHLLSVDGITSMPMFSSFS